MIVSVMCMHISCVDLCVHVFMSPMLSLLVYLGVLTNNVMLQAFICYCHFVKCS